MRVHHPPPTSRFNRSWGPTTLVVGGMVVLCFALVGVPQGLPNPSVETVPVVVTTAPIALGSAINIQSLQLVARTPATVPSDALRSIEEAQRARSTCFIPGNGVLTKSCLIGE